MKAPRSLAGQFVLLHLVTALVAAAVLPFGVAALLHHAANHYQRTVLQQQAQDVAAALRRSDPAQAIAAVDILSGGLTLTVVDGARHVLADRGPPRPAMIAAVPLADRGRIVRRDTVAAFSLPAGRRWVIVSQDASAPEVVTDDIISTFLKRFVLLLLPLLLLGPLVLAFITRRMTRRMEAASRIAAAIGPRALDRRLPRGTLPSEVEPLAAATNDALERLEQAFRAQAAFAADIAHELRTPLAVIRLRADAVADAAPRAALLAEVDRAARVIAQLLGLADLERPLEPGSTPVDLLALAEEVAADRAPGIIAGGRSIGIKDDGHTAIPGYRGAIQLALENLVDNAARYTPRGTRITISAGPGGRLTVTDDGDPLPLDRIERMATRFWRAGDAPPETREGFGLGLSIVARVARAHDGALRLAPGPDGRGLSATLILDAGIAPAS